jgi:Contractile injection system tube protein
MSDGVLNRALLKNEDNGKELTVHFNPKELSVSKSIPWAKHKTSESDAPTLEFTASEPKTLDVELLFDTYEKKTSVHDEIAKLDDLCKIINKSDKKRPPMVTWTWGKEMPTFKGVVMSLGVKYTMFLNDGTPCRATVTLKLQEASKVVSKDEGQDHRATNAAAGNDQIAGTSQTGAAPPAGGTAPGGAAPAGGSTPAGG